VRIYVGGLPYSTDSEGLRALFAEQGEVSDATVVGDRSTGQSKGFGFVEMPNDSEAESAIQKLNGKNMDGRNLTVNEFRPREESGGGDRGGGGGGDRRW
jgi:cold-inducible RNA-binding protein